LENVEPALSADKNALAQQIAEIQVSVVLSGVGLINKEVNRHWARLVLGWVTVYGRVNHLGM